MNLMWIGGGNMATALIGGLLQSKSAIRRLHVIEPDAGAREKLMARFSGQMHGNGIEFTVDATTVAESFAAASSKDRGNTWIMLAVKPQQMRQACEQATPAVRSLLAQSLLLSIAAGISVQALGRWCGNTRIVRAMPNTPALVTQGVTGLFAHASVSAQARAQADQFMRAVGQTVWIEQEDLMDAVTALSGSGPAYVFRFIEALGAAGQALGLSAQQSHALTLETLKGAVALLESSGETPAQLREKVTSKGGTTAAALHSLEQDQFMAIVTRALTAARDRGQEMSKEFQ